ERLGAAWIERQRAAFSLVVARLRRAEVRGARDQDAFGIEHTTGLRECREIGLVVDRCTRMKRPDWADGACAWNANGDDARLELAACTGVDRRRPRRAGVAHPRCAHDRRWAALHRVRAEQPPTWRVELARAASARAAACACPTARCARRLLRPDHRLAGAHGC